MQGNKLKSMKGRMCFIEVFIKKEGQILNLTMLQGKAPLEVFHLGKKNEVFHLGKKN